MVDMEEKFNDWLMDRHGDELHTKDQLIDAQEDGDYWQEFEDEFFMENILEAIDDKRKTIVRGKH